MPADTKSFTEVDLARLPWSVMMPTEHAHETDWMEGARALVGAAVPLYNASLKALQRKQLPRAIELAEQALQIMPYAPNLLNYAAALTIQHGDFTLAAHILKQATDLNLHDLVQPYAEALAQRVTQWNEALDHPETLHARYAERHIAPSYRDLGYLHNLGTPPLSPDLTRHLADYGFAPIPQLAPTPKSVAAPPPPAQRVPQWIVVAVSVLIAAVFGGLAGYFLVPSTAPAPAAQPPTVTAVPPPDSRQSLVDSEVGPVLDELAYGDAGTALTEMQRLRGERGESVKQLEALEQVALAKLAAEADPLWQQRNYAEVLNTLRPIIHVQNRTHPEALYYLGIAAEKTGETALAFDALSQFLAHEKASAFSRYRAQAAYSAALLAPPGEAKPFAQIIATEYASTLFYNSKIRSLIRDE